MVLQILLVHELQATSITVEAFGRQVLRTHVSLKVVSGNKSLPTLIADVFCRHGVADPMAFQRESA